MRYILRFAVLIVVLSAPAGSLVPSGDRAMAADPPATPTTPGELVIRGEDGSPAGACPLKHTDVDAQVSGFIARVRVAQEFHNPTSEKIEAVYTFPLPDDSAVDYMEMKVGERTIVGEIRPREEARRIYEAAKEAGHVASLLDQERPNIFTQSAVNIEPGAQVRVTISYTQLLKYEAGTYEFVFPMVVGPRFNPGSPVGHQGTGREPDTTQVPDASRITPPITPKGTRAGHDISVRVEVNAGIPIQKAHCVTHAVDYTWPDENTVVVTLKDRGTIPNKDFVLRYDVAGEMVQSGIITSAPGGKGGFFALVLQPPNTPKPRFVTPKEMVFVIDTSGSQMGEPLKKSKETMLHCIRNVNPGDTFNMISFSNSVRKLFDKPQPCTQANLSAALEFLKECEAGGGTEMLPAIKEAMAGPYDSERLRIVVFFTDGYIGNDFAVVDHIHKNAAHARVFSFGIGNAVNRFLIEKMAEAGRGASEVVLLTADSQKAAEKFYNRIRNPLLTDITVDWGGLPIAAEEVYPRRIPDLFSAQPLILKGFYTGPAAGSITVRGKVNGQPWSRTLDVSLPEHQSDNDALASIWARSKVDDLMSKDWLGAQSGTPEPNIKEQIVELALDYNLMTQYTSFVAVEKVVVTSGGTPKTVSVPVEMPEGVSYEGVLPSLSNDRGLNKKRAWSLAGYGTYTASTAPSEEARRAEFSMVDLDGVAAAETVQPPAREAVTPEQICKAVLVKRRVDKVLLDLIDNYKKKGESGSHSVPGKLVVKDDKVEVMVWVKAGAKEKIAELEKLGFSDHTWLPQHRILIGWMPIAKIEEAAQLDFVTRIGVPDYVGSK